MRVSFPLMMKFVPAKNRLTGTIVGRGLIPPRCPVRDDNLLGVFMPDRPYLFYELTNSLCGTCLRKVEAKVVIQDDNVYLHKWCPEHRFQKVLISTDAEYYKLSRQTIKPGQ